jgi:hypothetical protein
MNGLIINNNINDPLDIVDTLDILDTLDTLAYSRGSRVSRGSRYTYPNMIPLNDPLELRRAI